MVDKSRRKGCLAIVQLETGRPVRSADAIAKVKGKQKQKPQLIDSFLNFYRLLISRQHLSAHCALNGSKETT